MKQVVCINSTDSCIAFKDHISSIFWLRKQLCGNKVELGSKKFTSTLRKTILPLPGKLLPASMKKLNY